MALYEEFEPSPNRLISAQSSYLRAAAYQPIGWYEFGPLPFTEAEMQDKPILLDIGAAWCHWCHVIDRESYEDPAIATLINEHFIPIKVDRDERPDIDARYQEAVRLLTGQGGWPLTVFLTPAGEPFYGGTYFPPEDRYGRMGLKTLLPRLVDAFAHRRDELHGVATALTTRVRQAGVSALKSGMLDDGIVATIADTARKHFNPEQGGFERNGPKFPHAPVISLALLQWDRTRADAWRLIVEQTLLAMGRGGVYDQLGGGFHRYAVDADWIIPHFEKMSAENALLLRNYVQAFRATGIDFFREVAEGTLHFILSVLADREHGGFYASQDADVDMHDDGSYWTWSMAEVIDVLTPDEAEVAIRYFGLAPQGQQPGTDRNVLHIAATPAEIARDLDTTEESVVERLRSAERKLRAVRERRKAPSVDRNKYAAWNALLISACLEAGTLLGQQEAIDFALRTVETLLRDDYEADHGIYHALYAGKGARLPGYFEDQVCMAQALLDAFAVSGERGHLATACHLLDLCIDQYWDAAGGGGFNDIARGHEDAGVAAFFAQPYKPIDDVPLPAPNAVAALALVRAAALTRNARYTDFARRTLEAFAGQAPQDGLFAATYALAVDALLHPPATAVIIGRADDPQTRRLHAIALSIYRPGLRVAWYPPDAPDLPYPADTHGKAIAYVCAGAQCAKPTANPDLLRSTLETFGR